MLRARRLVSLWQRAQPTTDASLQRLSMRLARVDVSSTSVVSQRRWMSFETFNQGPVETDDKMTQLLEELEAYGETGKWRQALKLLDRVDKDEALPQLDPTMYERAIAACARMGKVEVLPGLLNNMLVDDLTPTSATMDFIIQAYLAKEHWGLIVQLASEATSMGVQLSPAAFHAIMEACGQIKDADSAMIIMKQLSEAGMELTTAHYTAAIRAAGMGRRSDTAMALFVQMEERDGLKDDGEAFSQLIRAQVINGELDQALQSFATVTQRGLNLGEPIYTCTIDALVSKGMHWQATRLFEQMLEGGEKHPSVFCLGRAMLAYTGANRSQHAWACWRKIIEINEPNPAPTKYNKMLQGLTDAKDTQLAVEVFDHIQNLFKPTQIHQRAYTTAIRAHGRLGNTQKAVDLFDEHVENYKAIGKVTRFVGIYLALFNALSRDTVRDPAVNTRDAKRAWKIMSANVPVVLPPAYASLAGVFASTGEMETLEELIEHAERSWGTTTGGIDQQEIDDDGDEMEALAVFDGEEVDLGSNNDVLLFNGVISGLCKARDDQTANIEAYLQMMISRGLPITDSIVRATTDACIRFENWGLMRKLLDMIDVDSLTNAEICTGDTVSKLLEASQWTAGREWLMFCHRHGLHPPVRRKLELLQEMSENKSREWRIAYSLATETMSFRRLVQQNVDSVADAADVCVNADRLDLAVKLFDAVSGHSSLRFFRNHQRQVQAGRDASQPLKLNIPPVVVPLRLYKNAILGLLRHKGGDNEVDPQWRMNKAERICRQMLEVHGKNLDGDALSMAISIKASAGDHDDVGALYETMRALGLEPNTYAQNAALIAFSRQRRTDQVLAIRDELMSNCNENGEIKTVEPNVARSLLLSLALAHENGALRDAVHTLPGCSMELALDVLMKANRSTDAVEFFDDDASSEMFESLFHQLCQSGNPVLGATLLLKFARLHGLDEVHPNRVIRVTNALVEKGNLVETEKLLQMYLDGTNGVSLKQMPAYFQQHTMEMLLFIYGEFAHFDAMRALFEKELLAFPLQVAHYEAAMEYYADSRDELAGAVASLKLFEMLRTHGFIRPSGYTYLLTLQSCLRLERLEPANASAVKSTGQIILGDVNEHGFQKAVVDELAEQVASTLKQVQVKNQKIIRRIKKEGDSTHAGVINPEELARIALFCHRHGMPMTEKLADNLLKLHQHIPVTIANELAFVKRSLEEGLGVVSAPGSRAQSIPTKRVVKVKKSVPVKAKRVPTTFAQQNGRPRSKSYEAAVRAATDARWGVVLEPIATDKK
ncbi:putative mitochondrial protein [Phytophthora megakarya]|uniref:Putative mitochondrial protein n=1 Tax=Phytophthora megakarya TaxID=4795 RepID=A0A225VPG1_9STRA|nr:putative mitochondrial protein [Phytophthora megakarya]